MRLLLDVVRLLLDGVRLVLDGVRLLLDGVRQSERISANSVDSTSAVHREAPFRGL